MNPYFQNLGNAIVIAFGNLWANILNFLPKVLGAAIVLLIGWIIAVALGVIAARLVMLLRVDRALEKLNVTKGLDRVGIRFSADKLIGWLVKWFFIIVFLIAAADILEWRAITEFLRSIVLYIPNVVISVVILLVGLVLGSFVGEIVKRAMLVARLKAGDFLALVARWAIVIFALMAALVQLGIASSLIQTLFTGLVAMLTIALGLAFGLGGKDMASKALEDWRKDLSEKK
jgi:hypothetical protein